MTPDQTPNLDYKMSSTTMTLPSTAGPTAADVPAVHHDPEAVGDPPPVPNVSRSRVALAGIVGMIVVAGMFFAGWTPKARQDKVLHADAEKVRTALPRVQTMLPKQSAAETTALLPGDVQAIEETTIYPRTTGYVKRWLVDLGDSVEQGQLLAEISTPEVDAQLEQAKATLAESEATLERAIASAKLAEINLRRIRALREQNASPQQQLDEAEGMAAVATANVRVAEATIKANKADVLRIGELQSFSKIVAPFRGRITARHIDVGQLVTPGNGVAQSLFQIARTNVVRVFLSVPQMYAFSVKLGLPAAIIVREKPEAQFIGKVVHTASAIDPTTRTLLTEVQIANEDNALLAGSYVQVELHVHRDNPPLLIPASALMFNADGTKVAVVGPSSKVAIRNVTVEGDFGAQVGIAKGIEAGDQVVVNPGDRMTDGLAVSVDVPQVAVTQVAAGR